MIKSQKNHKHRLYLVHFFSSSSFLIFIGQEKTTIQESNFPLKCIFLFFLPPISPLEFPAPLSMYQETNGRLSSGARGHADRVMSVLAVDPIRDYFLTDVRQISESTHDHPEQTLGNPKRKKWRNSRRRAVHRAFNFLHMKELANFQNTKKLSIKHPRESHRNPKDWGPVPVSPRSPLPKNLT